MYIVTTTRNGNPIQTSEFSNFKIADFYFLVESNRAMEDPDITATLTKDFHALKMVSNLSAWESERVAELTA